MPMRAIVGGEPSSRSALQRLVHRPHAVRADHEVFLNWANDSVASAVAESTQILRDVGAEATAGVRTESPSAASRWGTSSRRGARSLSPAPASTVYPASAGGALTARAAISDAASQEASLGRARSARDLFAALSDSAPIEERSLALLPDVDGKVMQALPPPDASSRVISVREFQRGTSVVKPAAPLPFPGPESLSPGERKRAQAAAQAAGRAPMPPAGARGGPQPTLADGVTSMITGVRGDLGEICTAPVSPFSCFDTLLDRLVDTPEACFVNPATLPWSPVVVTGRARGAPGPGMRGAFTFRT